MRISDWSSDVCSSDLTENHHFRLDLFGRHGLRLHRQAGQFPFGAFEEIFQHERHPLRGGPIMSGDSHQPLIGDVRWFIEDRRHRLENLEGGPGRRSEEHTSELQSLMRISYAVFCLKKKKTTT